MHKIEIYENGNLVTTLFVTATEKEQAETMIRTLIIHANLSSKRNYQYSVSKEL